MSFSEINNSKSENNSSSDVDKRAEVSKEQDTKCTEKFDIDKRTEASKGQDTKGTEKFDIDKRAEVSQRQDTKDNEKFDIDKRAKFENNDKSETDKETDVQQNQDNSKENTQADDSDTEKDINYSEFSADINDYKNIKKFINGELDFEFALEDYARIYAELVSTNRPWSWNDSIPFGENLTQKQKSLIKQEAIDKCLIPTVPIKEINGYKFLDFESAGLVKEVIYLPEDKWKSSDSEQFEWLNAQIGGKVEGYTWHHSEIPGKMELVPFGIHNIYNHNGGRSSGMWADAAR